MLIFFTSILIMTQKKYQEHLKSLKELPAIIQGILNERSGFIHRLANKYIGGIEKPLVEIVLKETNGNQTQAANILGINRNTLRKKISEYEIKCKSKT